MMPISDLEPLWHILIERRHTLVPGLEPSSWAVCYRLCSQTSSGTETGLKQVSCHLVWQKTRLKKLDSAHIPSKEMLQHWSVLVSAERQGSNQTQEHRLDYLPRLLSRLLRHPRRRSSRRRLHSHGRIWIDQTAHDAMPCAIRARFTLVTLSNRRQQRLVRFPLLSLHLQTR